MRFNRNSILALIFGGLSMLGGAAYAQSEVAPGLLSLQPQPSQCLAFNPDGSCAQPIITPTVAPQLVTTTPAPTPAPQPVPTPAATPNIMVDANGNPLRCIAFDPNGSCVLYQQVVSATPTTISVPTVPAVPTTTTIQAVWSVPAPLSAVVIPGSVKSLPQQTVRIPTTQIVRTVVQPARNVTSTFGNSRDIIKAILVPDYVLWHAGPSRYNWGGQEYGGRATAYSPDGWRAGFIMERGGLFAMGRISHYTEDKTFNYATGDLTIHRFTNAAAFTNTSPTTMTTDNQHNAVEGTIGVRAPFIAGVTSHVGLFGRVDEGQYKMTTIESAAVGAINANSTLEEYVDSVYLGPRAGLTILRDFLPNWRLRATGSAGPVWLRHSYAFNQTLSTGSVTGGLKLEGWGAMADGRLGFEHHMGGNLAVSFGAFGTYNTHGPKINRPTTTSSGGVELSTGAVYELGADVGLVVGF